MLRAQTGLLLLLMAGLAFAATETVTLWLSTRDLHSAAEVRSACSPKGRGPLCPPPCPVNSTKSTQCLYYLKESHKEEVCGPDLSPERRRNVLHGLRMRHCCEHKVDTALPEAAFQDGSNCRKELEKLLALDDLASRITCSHSQVLSRYDCGQTYSIAHRCDNCKEAYRRWVCSSLVPHFTSSGKHVRPCLSVCEDVEQQCPYLLPGDWTNQTVPPGETAHPIPQYAGEPTFFCLDPNIPETGEQRLKSSRGEEDCCYTHCGSPGRGGNGGGKNILGVCEHCPGRPFSNNNNNNHQHHHNQHENKENTNSNSNNNTVVVVVNANNAAGAVSPRTKKKVFLLWTAWILLLILQYTQTISIIIKCLLVLCAKSVRTTLKWIKTKWRPCS